MDSASEKIARDYFDAWNRRDFDHARSLLRPDYIYSGGDGKQQKGPEAGIAVGQMYATAFPDGKLKIDRLYAAGDSVTVECTATGTHKGDLMGVEPTGRKVEVPVCTILELQDGKIRAERQYTDLLHVMRQLGVITAPAGTRA